MGAHVVLVLTVVMVIVLLHVLCVLLMLGFLLILSQKNSKNSTAMKNANGEMKMFSDIMVDVFRSCGRDLRLGRSSVARQ